MRRFLATFRLSPATSILDVGGTSYNWELVGSKQPTTLINLVALPLEGLADNYRCVRASGTELCFPDASFDIAFSNSVIEHVGSRSAQRAFASELRRVGRQVWVQTPARSFPIEPHLLAPFIHFLPRRWQRRLARNFTLWGWITRPSPEAVDRLLDDLRLLDYDSFCEMFPDCEVRRERFCGLTKAYVAVRVDS